MGNPYHASRPDPARIEPRLAAGTAWMKNRGARLDITVASRPHKTLGTSLFISRSRRTVGTPSFADGVQSWPVMLVGGWKTPGRAWRNMLQHAKVACTGGPVKCSNLGPKGVRGMNGAGSGG